MWTWFHTKEVNNYISIEYTSPLVYLEYIHNQDFEYTEIYMISYQIFEESETI